MLWISENSKLIIRDDKLDMNRGCQGRRHGTHMHRCGGVNWQASSR